MSKLIEHAQRELELAGYYKDGPNDINAKMANSVLSIIETFSQQGYSGMSATHAIGLVSTLAMFNTLSPLTGADDEWKDITDLNNGTPMWQNIRNSRVFKREDGTCYDVEGKIFTDGKVSWTDRNSVVDVVFPYNPQTQVVQVAPEDAPHFKKES